MHNIYWLTGLPGSGKTSIATVLSKHLNAPVLNGDDIRSRLKNDDFSLEGRTRQMEFVAGIAGKFSHYTDVVVDLVSPIEDVRENIRNEYKQIKLVYVKCPLEVCMERDSRCKGNYAKAMAGEIRDFTGVSQPYEAPKRPDVVVETDRHTVEECVNEILKCKDYSPRALLIGRWQPFHDGHAWLVEQLQNRGYKVVIGIRDTAMDKDNPYSIQERIAMIERKYGDSVETLVVPNIGCFAYGRNVGYDVVELRPPEIIARISATAIRNGGARK